jgi:hypothetical protein
LRTHFKAYLPIYVVQAYLTLTLLIFRFGPINYNVESPLIFWGFLISYQIALFLGYMAVINTSSFKSSNLSSSRLLPHTGFTKFIIFLSFFASIISLKNISIFQIFNPIALWESVVMGILNPGDQYAEKIDDLSGAEGNKALNALLFLVAFSKVIIVPCLILSWNRLGIFFKIIGIYSAILPLINSISLGTNKAVFDFAIFFGVSLLSIYIHNKIHYGTFKFSNYKFFNFMLFFSFIGAFAFFAISIGQRGGDVLFVMNPAGLGDIKLNNYNTNYNNYGNLWYVYTWFSNYLVQGYYGFALALETPFTSTFGFGHSVFLIRQVYFVTGFDLTPYTFQNKITNVWDESAQWHSFYSHIANDVHFFGVAIVMFFIGVLLAKVWARFIIKSDYNSYLFLPLLALLIIFIPANNQIFGLLDTFSAFIFILFGWMRINVLK